MTKQIRIAILGSTGSIGCNALEVIDNLISNGVDCKVVLLTTNSNTPLLKTQSQKYFPETVVISNGNNDIEEFSGAKVLYGNDGLLEATSTGNYDILISSLVGFAGLAPTIEAIKLGKQIALANKETLVVAGGIITKLARENKSQIIPIDSEHSAILQCLEGEDQNSIEQIILTASGGPFRTKSIEEIKSATVEDALNHPNWNMGNKITIDSATLMNKGLEVIEAKWLFNVPLEKIKVVVHPQSIIHSMVEFHDGSIKAQLGIPDMKIPIQYALTYPERIKSNFPRMDFLKNNILNFVEPDLEKFECLKLCYQVLQNGGTYPVVLNAANEIAISLFLDSKISFWEIASVIKQSLNEHVSKEHFTLDDIVKIDKEVRIKILEKFKVNSQE